MVPAQAIQTARLYKAVYDNKMFVKLSHIRCNCQECQKVALERFQAVQHYDFSFSQHNLRLKTAGHSSLKNVLYYEIPNEYCLLTLECTSLEGFEGFAETKWKTEHGKVLFYTINIPVDGKIAI